MQIGCNSFTPVNDHQLVYNLVYELVYELVYNLVYGLVYNLAHCYRIHNISYKS